MTKVLPPTVGAIVHVYDRRQKPPGPFVGIVCKATGNKYNHINVAILDHECNSGMAHNLCYGAESTSHSYWVYPPVHTRIVEKLQSVLKPAPKAVPVTDLGNEREICAKTIRTFKAKYFCRLPPDHKGECTYFTPRNKDIK